MATWMRTITDVVVKNEVRERVNIEWKREKKNRMLGQNGCEYYFLGSES